MLLLLLCSACAPSYDGLSIDCTGKSCDSATQDVIADIDMRLAKRGIIAMGAIPAALAKRGALIQFVEAGSLDCPAGDVGCTHQYDSGSIKVNAEPGAICEAQGPFLHEMLHVAMIARYNDVDHDHKRLGVWARNGAGSAEEMLGRVDYCSFHGDE